MKSFPLALACLVLPASIQAQPAIAPASPYEKALAPLDAFIAATAQIADLTLVTRNVSDFAILDLPMISPWTVV